MTPDQIVRRLSTSARANFAKFRAGMQINGAQLNGLKSRGAVVWQDFPSGWICRPDVARAFDRRWPKNPR